MVLVIAFYGDYLDDGTIMAMVAIMAMTPPTMIIATKSKIDR